MVNYGLFDRKNWVMLLESLTLEFGDKTQTFKRLQLQCAAWVPVKWMRGFKTRVPWPEKVKTTPVHYTLYPNTKHSNTRPVLSLSLSFCCRRLGLIGGSFCLGGSLYIDHLSDPPSLRAQHLFEPRRVIHHLSLTVR